MRTSAFSAAILTLATFASSVSANDDFSALLADLSFGDAPSLSEPLAVAEEDTVADLKPVPTGITMPGMVEMTPPVDIATDHRNRSCGGIGDRPSRRPSRSHCRGDAGSNGAVQS